MLILYGVPTYNGITPDPNAPDSPEIIIVLDEDDIPYTFRKTFDKDYNANYTEDPTIPI